MGPSGINKSGATIYFDYVFKTVRDALILLANDSEKCFEKGVYVAHDLIPELDNTATQAALIHRNSINSNLLSNQDEWATAKRKALNGGYASLDVGNQHYLNTWNGPPLFTNELNGNIEHIYLARHITLTNIQTQFAHSDLGEGTALFDVEYTARNLFFQLHANIDTENMREPLRRDTQTLVEFILAVAAAGHVVTGSWVDAEDQEQRKIAFFGGQIKIKDREELSSFEKNIYDFSLKKFVPNHLGEKALAQFDEAEAVRDFNRQGEFERTKAASKGERVPIRYQRDRVHKPPDDGTGVSWPSILQLKGIYRIQVFDCGHNTPASIANRNVSHEITKRVANYPNGSPQKNMHGKSMGNYTRILGACEALKRASEKVQALLGRRALPT